MEARAQHVDVVTGALGRRLKGAIGHHQSVGGIAGNLETRQPPRLVGRQFQAAELFQDRLAKSQLRRLQGDLAQLIEGRQAL